MKIRGLTVVLGICLLAAGSVASRAAPPGRVTLRDDLQREVTFASNPQRIISLLPSLTEIVCALGACDRLVATDRFSDWPLQVRALPKAGGLDDVSVEAIVSLQADLVLLARPQRITARLTELAIPSFALETQSYADIGHSVTMIGQILNVPQRAQALVRSIDADVQRVAGEAVVLRHGVLVGVYLEVDPAPYAAGPDSFIGELLARLGTRNIVTADLGPFPKLNPEYVVRHNPDVIIVASADMPHFAQRPGWSSIRAVKENRVCSFTAQERDTLMRPGPRVAEGMRALAECLKRFSP